jgi:protein-export membrane protein SecD
LAVTVVAVVAILVFQLERNVSWLILIILLVAMAGYISHPADFGFQYDFNNDGEYEFERTFEVRQGLDLQGGLQVLLEADVPPNVPVTDTEMDAVRINVERRIDSLGVVEPVVQRQGERRIIVELPGIDNPDQALELIQETALLEFVEAGFTPLPAGSQVMTDLREDMGLDEEVPEADSDAEFIPLATHHTVMTGADLRAAEVILDPQTNQPLVSFELTPEGADIFAEYTSDHVGEFLAIVLDGEVISSPQIRDAIITGSGVITGSFTYDEANSLVIQLRAGSLEVPLRVESTSSIGPSLGALSVEQSIRAGIIGISVVLLFMLVYYRLPGIAADLALIAFALLNFALFKLIPVTLTLPAITGFLISVGTAVDGNILIFERTKEELRAGKRLDVAVRAGFERAWTSIRDSNLSTIIICAILYFFGSTFGAGAVRGFAVTLAIGLVINLFTAVTVTRTFLHFLLPAGSEWIAERRWLLGI